MIHTNEKKRQKAISESIAVILFTLINFAVLFQGLMFEQHFIIYIIMVGSLGLVLVFLSRSIFNAEDLLSKPSLYLASLLLLSYLLSLRQAAYMRSAIIELNKYMGIFVLVMVCIMQTDRKRMSLILGKLYYISTVFIAFIGLDALWSGKTVVIINKIAYFLGHRGEFDFLYDLVTNERINSVFQYPNTTAIVLLIAVIFGIELYSQTEKTITKWLYAATLPLIVLVFFLTMSRGAFLLAPLLLLLYFILLSPYQKLQRIICLGGSIASAMIMIFIKINNGLGSYMGINRYLMLVSLSILSAFIINLLDDYYNKSGCLDKINCMIKINPVIRNVLCGKISIFLMLFFVLGCFSTLVLWTKPVDLPHDSPFNIQRVLNLKDPGDYSLQIEFETRYEGDLRIDLRSFSMKEKLTNKVRNLLIFEEELNNEYNEIKLDFSIVDDATLGQTLIIKGTPKISNAISGMKVVELESGKVIEKIRLTRRYLNESVSLRFDDMFSSLSALSRIAFYLDGIELIKDNILTGVGGGGWKYKYGIYQSYRYVSNDVHSYGFQVWIESGLLGLLSVTLLFMFLAYRFIELIKEHNSLQAMLWIGSFGLLLHGMIDFDFSFYVIHMWFWSFLALQTTDLEEKIRHKISITGKGSERFRVAIIMLLLGSLFWPVRFQVAAHYATLYNVNAMKGQIEEAVSNLEKAHLFDPYRSEYPVILARLIVQMGEAEKADQLIEKGLKLSRFNYDVLGDIGDYYQRRAMWEEAYDIESNITSLRPLVHGEWLNKGKMIDRAIQWYVNQEREMNLEYGAEIRTWIRRGLDIEDEMLQASKGKFIDMLPNQELQVLIEKWTNMLK